MSEQTEFYLNRRSDQLEYETVEISHPSFSKTYYIVTQNAAGLTAKLETGESVFFEYYPLRIQRGGIKDDLDQSLKITIGDTGDVLPEEIDAAYSADTLSIKPTVIYRTYRSDNLENVMFGPVVLECGNISSQRDGSMLDAQAPYLNRNKTGEIYSLSRFSMLRGVL